MKIALTIIAAALTATSDAQAACPPGKVAVPHARGGTVCIFPSKNIGECVANSLRNGFPDGQSQSYCRQRFSAAAGTTGSYSNCIAGGQKWDTQRLRLANIAAVGGCGKARTLNSRQFQYVPLQFPLPPMLVFAGRVKHALDGPVDRSHDADAREHRWPVKFGD